MPRAPFTLAESTDDLKHAMARLAGRPLLALDLETTGLDPHSDEVVLVSVGDDSEQLLVDCRKVSLEPLVPLLQGPVVKVTHNGAFDVSMLRSLGVHTENVLDTMLIEQVVQNGRAAGPRSLAALSERYLGVVLDKTERLGFARTSGAFSPVQLEYARRDILATYQVLLEQMSRLSKDGLEDTARVECEAVPAFADLYYDGVFLDRQAWSGLIDEARKKRDRARGEIDEHLKEVASTDLFGRVDVNLESDAELKTVLSRLLKKRVQDVNKAALRHIDHPVGAALAKYREMSKIVSAYGETFLEAVHPKTGRIHADFQQIGAPTGRVACARPNLQNIPRGSRFRRCFCAPEGRRMVTADYSGCELRILAEMSGDSAFINTFQRGGDLHAIVASEIFSTPVAKDRNPELRDRAKAINFGLAYGMGPGGLATVTGVSLSEAERLLKRYFEAYPQVKQYLDRSARTAVERGFAETLGGRKLFLQIGERMEGPDLASIIRVAKNMPIQGTNADMLKVAMAGIRRRLLDGGMDACMVSCVHDEILLEAEEGEAWDAAEVVREEMVKAGERYVKKVPIVVDVSVGDSWLK